MSDRHREERGAFEVWWHPALEREHPCQPTAWEIWQAGREYERNRTTGEAAAAYTERNHLASALAHLFPSGIARTAIPGWDEEWHGCVYIDLPTGQISYHYHDSEHYLFVDLPPYRGIWDGHDKETVHQRLMDLRASCAVALSTVKPSPLTASAEMVRELERLRALVADYETLRPEEEYHEDMGPVLWWKLPVDEPPYCGSPLNTEWPGYHTHFTPIVRNSVVGQWNERAESQINGASQ